LSLKDNPIGGLVTQYFLILVFIVISNQLTSADDSGEVVTTEKEPAWYNVFSSAVSQDEACQELRPGGSTQVNMDWNQNQLELDRRYSVQRSATNPKEFNVRIPIRFEGTQDVLNRIYGQVLTPEELREGRNGDLAARFMNRANECFRRYAENLKDSRGNYLNVTVVSPSSSSPVSAHPVSVAERGRSNNESWDSRVGCGTIMHEVLHLTGLQDRYQERETTVSYDPSWWPFSQDRTVIAYNCRNVREGTIMGSHPSIMGGYNIELLRCQIASCSNLPLRIVYTSPKITNHYNRVRGNWMYGVTDYETAYHKATLRSLELVNVTDAQVAEALADVRGYPDQGRGYLLSIVERPTKNRMLADDEFNYITRPLCYRDNNYSVCNRNAYRTREIEGCLEVPSECN
jgi:hypothetical protein